MIIDFPKKPSADNRQVVMPLQVALNHAHELGVYHGYKQGLKVGVIVGVVITIACTLPFLVLIVTH